MSKENSHLSHTDIVLKSQMSWAYLGLFGLKLKNGQLLVV